ncbi:hypothetical protein ACEWY4_018228 [Coilia grayii]|uniref:Integrase zinc-binding domain-containing protein n=1 Tax=Coilia grayii TaxID=363190 RepID=A0ABD1JJ26_9TELE
MRLVVMSEEQKRAVLAECHNNPGTGNHGGVRATMDRVVAGYYWDTIKADVAEWALNACETDAAFEMADPEEELDLKLAKVKALNEKVLNYIEKGTGETKKKTFETKKRKGVHQGSVKAGDEVLIGEPQKKVMGNSLQDLHQGPFTLTSLTEKSVAVSGKMKKLNVSRLRPYFRPQDHSHETEDITLVDHHYTSNGPLWSKRLGPDQEQLLTYVLDKARPAKEIVVLDGPTCLQREDFWTLGLDEEVESNVSGY